MRKRDLLKKYSFIVKTITNFYSVFPKKFRLHCFYRSLGKRGYYGILKRYCLLRTVAKSCGENVAIFENAVIRNVDQISFGNNVSLQPNCYLEGLGGIEIGDDVIIAVGVSIVSTTHIIESIDIPISDQGISLSRVIIGDDVWIGTRATVLCGRKIGKGAVIGANSVVTKDVPPYSVCAGTPAKIIRSRR